MKTAVDAGPELGEGLLMFRDANRVGWILAMFIGLPSIASAGPYLGESWRLCGCPKGDYSPLHYWMPGVYRVRAWAHPSSVDQFVEAPGVPVVNDIARQRCIPKSPEPSSPYADPEAFYGRRVLPNPAIGSR